MKTNKVIALISTLALLGGVAQAQGVQGEAGVSVDAQVNVGAPNGRPPMGGPGGRPPEGRGMMGQGMGRGGMMGEKRGWMMASGTASTSMWMKGEGMKMREDMRGKMASLTADQLIQISTKLGITVAELQAKIAAGTNLREIIGNKISREELMQIFPMPMMGTSSASGTRPMWGGRNHDGEDRGQRPHGFVNQLRNKIMGMFGGGDGSMNADENAEVNANANANAGTGLPGFFKRFFNF